MSGRLHRTGARRAHRRVLFVTAAAVAGALLLAPRAAAAKERWKVVDVQATICADGKPFFGTPNRVGYPKRLWCKALATTVTGRVAYNGKQAWGRFIDCPRSLNGPVVNKVTWCQYWNNGATAPEKYMDLGANGEVSMSANASLGAGYGPLQATIESKVHHIHSYWLRIDVTPKGKVKLRGGLYTG